MPTQYPTRASIHRTTTQATQASAPHATVRVIKAQPKFDHNPTASTASAHNQNHQAHLPTVNTVVEASRAAIQSAAPSRADRRRAQQVADQLIRDHRRSQRQRMAAGGSLLAAAAATLVTTTTVGPASHPAPADIEVADQATGDIEGAIRARTGSAGRSGNRVELSTLANGDLATPAEVLDTAAEVLARTSELTAVESRTTPDHLAEVLAARDDVLTLHALLEVALPTEIVAGHTAPAPLVTSPIVIETPATGTPAIDGSQDDGDTDVDNPSDSDDAPAIAVDDHSLDLGDLDDPYYGMEGDDMTQRRAPETIDELTEALHEATDYLDHLLEIAPPAVLLATGAPMTAREILDEQAALPRLDSAHYARVFRQFSNGRIPASAMTRLSWAPGHMARPDAALQLERLNVAFRAQFGTNLAINSSYRDFAGQVRSRARHGRWAATPGTSNHGWGLAIDFQGGIQRFGTPQHRWMQQNAHRFGWIHPSWARQGGNLPEPWHWEFGDLVGGVGD